MPSAAKTGVTTFSTPSDTQVRLSRTVNAPRHLVYEAHIKPEHLQKWLGFPEGWTMPICEMDARPGGAWRYGWRQDSGTEMIMGGIVKDIVPNERIVTTERWGPEWPETLNTVEFTEAGGLTTITTTVTYPSKEARDAAIQTGMKDGLEVSYSRLEKLLETLV
jgi:uncharacterized protein YndB with AHSA1/START domain